MVGPPQSGYAGSVGNPGQYTPANTPAPASEREITAGFRDRRDAARRYYRETGDSGPMWQAKADEADAVNAHRRSRRRS
ncbi:hypothetical protein G6W57_00965 [Streptomyces sp. CAI-121]|uniref:hypothetical protein n=1 Tax=unclassified Streptomyces TaxID=2593676 RepID=UPI001587CDCD|nr:MULTISPECIES: hypothetical protein [unclassified Streptomyces]NUV65686.1 hypothetical protein [Streptomyces sp. CAI-121]NUW12423.1 hypothetical protein [Streptomyces sp. CAI-68]